MNSSKNLFGTSGIRGDAETLFTNQFCFDIGRAFAIFLTRSEIEGSIAIGTDPRGSSPRIKASIEKGVWYEKREIFDQGATPVPSMCYLLNINTSYAGSMMVTGSHIKSNLNGVKFFVGNGEISKSDEKKIQDIFYLINEKVKYTEATEPEKHTDSSAIDNYNHLLRGLSQEYPKWKIALDCANGAQSLVIPHLLSDMGFDVVKINCDIEEDFIARDTDTDDQAEIEELKKTIIMEHCDFGIAFDGDGDRVVFLDEKGTFIQGEYTCVLIAKKTASDSVVTTVSASQIVDKIEKRIFRTKVGAPYLIEKMKDTDSLFGFEANGGAVSAEIMFTRDGGVTMMKILNIFSQFTGKFSEMIQQLPKYYMMRTKVDYRWEQQDKIISKVLDFYKDKKIDNTDGLKIWINDDSWMLFRSSANAPEFRIFAESLEKHTTEKMLDEGVELVRSVISA